MEQYDDDTLLHVHQLVPVLISSFCRRMRPPSYVGRVERAVRGYLREKPSDEQNAATICLGGLPVMRDLWWISGYNSRRVAMDKFFDDIQAAQRLGPQPATRDSSLSLARLWKRKPPTPVPGFKSEDREDDEDADDVSESTFLPPAAAAGAAAGGIVATDVEPGSRPSHGATSS